MTYFKEFPFRETPPNIVDFWADRAQVKTDLEKIVLDFKTNKDSKIIPVWGVWGNGKSHSLRYIKSLLGDSVEFIYGALAKDAKNFGSLYKQNFINNFDFRRFATICKNIYVSTNKSDNWLVEYAKIEESLFGNSFDFSKVVFETGKIFDIRSFQDAFQSETFRTIIQWLKGERLTKSQLNLIGVSHSLQNDTDYVNAFCCLVRLLNSEYAENRLVIWALDDCQVMIDISYKTRMQIQQGLRAAFDGAYSGLLIMIGLASRSYDTVESLFIDDIKSRFSSDSVKLTNFDSDNLNDAMSFIKDLITNPKFKLDSVKGEWYPFEEKAVKDALKMITKVEGDFTPRIIMKYFNSLVSDAQRKNLKKINSSFVTEFFNIIKEQNSS